MTKFLNAFVKDEDGAVSIDWVVLTAAIVAMGVAAGSSIRSTSTAVSGNVDTYAQSIDIATGAATTTP
jgi:Flp pilus assembly pilin Flp